MQEVNVQVAVRVRPLLPKEKLAGETVCVRIQPNTNQLILGKDRVFTFDHILTSRVTQHDVYEQCVDPLVRSCLEGYNATVFAYGQTGSGKTYTMGGGCLLNQTDDDLGIIPRAVQHIFDVISSNTNRYYTLHVSYIEIYKEELYDLLDLDNISKDLHIREDNNGNTVIVGVTEMVCETIDDVMSFLERGSTYRRTGITQMNEHSSRSHSVFTLVIEQRWSDDIDSRVGTAASRKSRRKSDASDEASKDAMAGEFEHYMCAKFHFVDLAGSERANRTGNVGERFKESVHINSGLLALGNVISALGDIKKRATLSHIPYRDSKITRLLKDSLGGNAKTLMICCVSPSSASFDESLNSLKYANRARNIRNKPIINRDPQSLRFEEMQSEIKALREELHRQRTSMLVATQRDEFGGYSGPGVNTDEYKQLQDRLIRLQTECGHYKAIADEAYRLLTEMRDRDALTQSQAGKLCDWLELVDEMKNTVPPTLNRDAWDNKTILQLEKELEQCKSDLKCDEEIFAEKSRVLNDMQETISRLEHENQSLTQRLESAEESIHRLNEQMLVKQLEIDKLNSKLKEQNQQLEIGTAEASLDLNVETVRKSANLIMSRQRAVSVPAHFLATDRSLINKEEFARDIHSSPATFTITRIVHCFRARSAMLVSQLEDNDEVLQKTFSDDDQGNQDETDVAAVEEENLSSERTFIRNDATRQTYRINPTGHLNRPSVEPNRISKRGTKPPLPQSTAENGEWMVPHPGGTQVLRLVSTSGPVEDDDEINRVRASTERHSKQLRQTQLDVKQSEQKMKDLTINIRLKEQLIKQLVKTAQEAQQINAQREAQIHALEEEKTLALNDLSSLQKALEELMQREQTDKQQGEQQQIEFRKKMEIAKSRINALKKKQKETEKMMEVANVTINNSKRVQELECAISNMRLQQDQLQRHLKDVSDQKTKLEREVQKEQQRVRELEMSSEQHRRVLRVKLDEMSVLQRRLRSAGLPLTTAQTAEEQSRFEEQRRWLEQEMDMMLKQRQTFEELQKELQQKEEILAKREAMLAEKSELEMKKLRSSQVMSKDLGHMSSRLDNMERQMEEKTREMALTSSHGQMEIRAELEGLHQARDRLKVECGALQAKNVDGMTETDNRRLFELEEEIDALDAAIEFKNELIARRENTLRQSVVRLSSVGMTGNRLNKLQSLSATETRLLLDRYFSRVVDLRDGQRRMKNHCAELEMKIDEQMVKVAELESCVERAAMDADRRLTQQQQEYERRIQLLMKQLTQSELSSRSDLAAQLKLKDTKISELEKDVYYYKMTSREFKKKLRHAGRDSARESSTADGKEAIEYIETPRPPGDIHNQDTPRLSSRPNSARQMMVVDASVADTARSKSAPTQRDVTQSSAASQSEAHGDGLASSRVTPRQQMTPRDLPVMSARGDGVHKTRVDQTPRHGSDVTSVVPPGTGRMTATPHESAVRLAGHGQGSVDGVNAVPADSDVGSRPVSSHAAHTDKKSSRPSTAAGPEDMAARSSVELLDQVHRSQRRSSRDVSTRKSGARSVHDPRDSSSVLADSLDGAS